MIGAIVGDIVGSRFEWQNCKSKDFELFHDRKYFTDDTVMTLAIGDALVHWEKGKRKEDLGKLATESMRKFGFDYPGRGYGGMFLGWLCSDDPKPYNSFGNGAAMRVSGCGYAAKSLKEAKELSKAVTEVTHNHPEGIKGAEAVTVAIFLAREGKRIKEIKDYIIEHYYKIDFTLDSIREEYHFDVTCQGSVPQAFEAFFESESFEDAIRNAISIGGDSDTIAAITGSIAEVYYGVPKGIRNQALKFLDEEAKETLASFEKTFPAKKPTTLKSKNNTKSKEK